MRSAPNCQHLDNYRDCRILHEQGMVARYFGLRPHCVLDRGYEPRDGKWTCNEQLPYPPPAGPPPMPRKK